MILAGNSRRWIRRSALALLFPGAILAIAALVLNRVERTRNIEEEYAVYSSYLSKGVLTDPHDWSVGPSIQVVIENKTSLVSGRWWRLYSQRGGAKFEHLRFTTLASFLVRNLVRTSLKPKFRLPSRATTVLLPISEIESTDFQKRFPNNMGHISFSGVGFNGDQTQSLFYIDHFCGLCGGGRYVLMEKVSGLWKVRGENYTWIS